MTLRLVSLKGVSPPNALQVVEAGFKSLVMTSDCSQLSQCISQTARSAGSAKRRIKSPKFWRPFSKIVDQ